MPFLPTTVACTESPRVPLASPADREAAIETIGDAIADLAARLHAATCELLVLLRQFDTRRGWNNGFLSCAHWLHWRTGIDPGAAREKVRVARALATLPHISAAMQRGELSYAKVRALSRIATPDNETQLPDVAPADTAAQVERLVRAWRRVDRVEAAQQAERRHQHRELATWVDDDGMVIVRGRLTPEAGAVPERALEAAADRLFRESAHGTRPALLLRGPYELKLLVRAATAGRIGTYQTWRGRGTPRTCEVLPAHTALRRIALQRRVRCRIQRHNHQT